jgi:hypothetical protein
MNEFDDLDAPTLRWWESAALMGALGMIIMLCVGIISFTTGYAWAYLQAGILSLGL